MVRKYRPGFQLPAELFRVAEQEAFEQVAFGLGIEQVLFVKRAGRDDVDTVLRQAMDRSMRPVLRRQLRIEIVGGGRSEKVEGAAGAMLSLEIGFMARWITECFRGGKSRSK